MAQPLSIAVGASFGIAAWAAILWLKFGLPQYRAKLANRAYRSRCDYATNDNETASYLDHVNTIGREKTGDHSFDIGPCGNCHNRAPRWMTKTEVAARAHQIAEGWITSDGRPCDVALYQEAFRRQVTPAQVLAERDGNSAGPISN